MYLPAIVIVLSGQAHLSWLVNNLKGKGGRWLEGVLLGHRIFDV